MHARCTGSEQDKRVLNRVLYGRDGGRLLDMALSYLSIHMPSIVVDGRLVQELSRGTFSYEDGEPTVTVWRANMPLLPFWHLLVHELVHCAQHAHGLYEIFPLRHAVRWQDTEYRTDIPPYDIRPWEIDAKARSALFLLESGAGLCDRAILSAGVKSELKHCRECTEELTKWSSDHQVHGL
jgi:hypothetical protein